jgi:flavin reductase (DIM6/NTAB) family NADH-FMN oxidoreductase RutF
MNKTPWEIIMSDSELLRSAMRQWATGVAVVTSSHAGIAHGMTVSSFTSVSLTPPQVLISLAQNTRTHTLVKASRCFGVTLLAHGQQEISDRFAGRIADELDRLAGLETFTLESGVPLLKDGIAQFDCHVIATFTSGTHTIFIGAVLAAKSEENADPLLYYNREYRHIA